MVVTVGETADVTWPKAPGTDAGSLTVTDPTGGMSNPAVVATGTGLASSVVTTVPGRYLLSWARGTRRYVDVLDVWPADPRYLVSLAEVAATNGRSDADLALQVAVASWIVESLAGIVLPRVKSYRVIGGNGVEVLPDVDVDNVTVLVDEVAYPGAVDVDEMAGIVSGVPTVGRVVLTYSVGSHTIPPPLRQAAHDIAIHLLRSARQGGTPGSSQPAADTIATPYGFAIPRRAYELCASVSSPAPGFA